MIKMIKDEIPERCVVFRSGLLSFIESPD